MWLGCELSMAFAGSGHLATKCALARRSTWSTLARVGKPCSSPVPALPPALLPPTSSPSPAPPPSETPPGAPAWFEPASPLVPAMADPAPDTPPALLDAPPALLAAPLLAAPPPLVPPTPARDVAEAPLQPQSKASTRTAKRL